MNNNFETLNNQAVELAAEGSFTEAIACFHAALHMDQNNYLLWYNLGVTYRDAGEVDHAKKAMITAHQLEPDDEDILENLSVLCYLKGDVDDAFKYAREALQLNGSNAHIWNNMGVFWFSQQNYEKASRSFEKALSIYPHYVDALINLRDTYTEMNNDVGRQECINRLKKLGHKGISDAQ